MGHIICITSQKGGVGKTTTAINLATALALAEKKLLLVDCDPQGNATSSMGIDKRNLRVTLYDAMIRNEMLSNAIIDSEISFLKMLPACIDLARTETELFSKPGKEKILRNLLHDFKDAYDYIIIDSPPSLSILTVNAIIAADSLLIPLQCEFYALESMRQLLKTIRILKQKFNPDLRIDGILLTMFKKNEEISSQIAEEVRNHFKYMVFKTVVPRNVQLRESAVYGKPLLLQDILSQGARSYMELASEIMAMRAAAEC